MKYEQVVEFECPRCGKAVEYDESLRGVDYLNDEVVAVMSRDCHGIPFRMVCLDCYEAIEYSEEGYDGEYYTEFDECIDYDY